MARWVQSLKFFLNFVRHPFTTGAVAPSSPALADTMVEGMGLGNARVAAEFGAGTGVFTRRIASMLGADAVFLVFEINGSMASMLAENMPGLDVIVDSARNLPAQLARRGLDKVDCVICGLPWAVFSSELQDEILAALSSSLAPQGRFATFAYLHASWFPAARKFRKKLDGLFSRVEASRVVWRNFPPAFVWRCTK